MQMQNPFWTAHHEFHYIYKKKIQLNLPEVSGMQK